MEGPEFKDSLSYIARGRKGRMKEGRGGGEGGREEKERSFVAGAPPNLGKGANISRTLYLSNMLFSVS